MNTSDSLQTLADWVAAFEAAGYDITEIEPLQRSIVDTEGATASLTLQFQCGIDVVDADGAEVTPREARITEDGTVCLDVDLRLDSDAGTPAVRGLPDSATTQGAAAPATPGDTPVEEGAASGSSDTGDTGRTGGSTDGDTNGDDLPEDSTDSEADDQDTDDRISGDGNANDGSGDTSVYRDPERLQAVYDSERTFEEMRDALGVEVTPQTVRKYMVEHGIHEPAEQATSLRNADIDALVESAAGDDPADLDDNGIDDPTSDDSVANTKQSDSTHPVGGETVNSLVTAVDQSSSGFPSSSDSSTAELAVDAADRNDDSTAPSDDVDTDAEADPANATASDTTDVATTDRDAEGAAADSTISAGISADSDDPESAADGDPFADLPSIENLSDDLEVPDDLTIADIVEAVQDAQTFHDVKQTLELDHETTQRLLSELDLLDLVHGRLSTRGHNVFQ